MSTHDPDTDPIRNAARTFMAEHLGEHLSAHRALLVDRCTVHVAKLLNVPADDARRVTLQVLGELEARGCAAFIDLTSTTSYTVFVRDPATGATVVFTAADLIHTARRLRTSAQPLPVSEPAYVTATRH